MSAEHQRATAIWPAPDAFLDWTEAPPSDGATCALLAPALKAKLRELAAGQTLEVRVANPTARIVTAAQAVARLVADPASLSF